MIRYKRLLRSLNSTCNKCLLVFENERLKQDRDKLKLAGTINCIWQSWNRFWRQYWVSSFTGFIDLSGAKCSGNGLLISNSDSEIIYYLLYLLGKRNRAAGRIAGSFQEITWGTSDNIVDIALAISERCGRHSHIPALASMFARSVNHLHLTRNCVIHLNSYNMRQLRSVVPFYSLSNIFHPTELLFTSEIGSSVDVYKKWIRDLQGYAYNII